MRTIYLKSDDEFEKFQSSIGKKHLKKYFRFHVQFNKKSRIFIYVRSDRKNIL
jgi:hypothetical protein